VKNILFIFVLLFTLASCEERKPSEIRAEQEAYKASIESVPVMFQYAKAELENVPKSLAYSLRDGDQVPVIITQAGPRYGYTPSRPQHYATVHGWTKELPCPEREVILMQNGRQIMYLHIQNNAVQLHQTLFSGKWSGDTLFVSSITQPDDNH
jgi:hypothetical protein